MHLTLLKTQCVASLPILSETQCVASLPILSETQCIASLPTQLDAMRCVFTLTYRLLIDYAC
jgi:hypothetical protein